MESGTEDRVELIGCLTRPAFSRIGPSELEAIGKVARGGRHPRARFGVRRIERRTHRPGELLHLGVPWPERAKSRQLGFRVPMAFRPRERASKPEAILEPAR